MGAAHGAGTPMGPFPARPEARESELCSGTSRARRPLLTPGPWGHTHGVSATLPVGTDPQTAPGPPPVACRRLAQTPRRTSRPSRRPLADGRWSGSHASVAEASRPSRGPSSSQSASAACSVSLTARPPPKGHFTAAWLNLRRVTLRTGPMTRPELPNLTPQQGPGREGEKRLLHGGGGTHCPGDGGQRPAARPLGAASHVSAGAFSNHRHVTCGRGGLTRRAGSSSLGLGLARNLGQRECGGAALFALMGTCLGGGRLTCTPTTSVISRAPHPPARPGSPSGTAFPGGGEKQRSGKPSCLLWEISLARNPKSASKLGHGTDHPSASAGASPAASGPRTEKD